MADESEAGKKPAEKDKAAAEHREPKAPKAAEGAEAHREPKAQAHKASDGAEAHKEPKVPKAAEGAEAHKEPKAPKAAEGAETHKDHKAAHKPAAAGAAAPKKKVPAHPAAAKAPRPKAIGKTDIGIDVKPPVKACTDQHCPFHGRLPVRGQIFEGIVVSAGMDKSAVIQRERMVYVPKYERFLKRTSRMSVHSPPCIEAAAGDQVTVMECRPLSKTISFTIVSKRAETKAGKD